jgi:hypothetical protein
VRTLEVFATHSDAVAGGASHRVDVTSKMPYDDVARDVRAHFELAPSDAALYCVGRESGEDVGCMADIEMTPYATDKQLKAEGVDVVFVFKSRSGLAYAATTTKSNRASCQSRRRRRAACCRWQVYN